MQFDFTIPKEPTRCWDLAVPITSNGKATHAYLTDDIIEPAAYNELCFLLTNADADEEFHLHINTPGGLIDSAVMIINAINSSKAKVIGHLSGTVASAGTIIALSCTDIKVAPHTSFMIHNYSAGISGKGHEMKARQEFIDSSLNEAFKVFYTGFLTDDEMASVIDGKDMWMGTSEVISRWANKTSGKLQDAPKKRGRGRPAKAK